MASTDGFKFTGEYVPKWSLKGRARHAIGTRSSEHDPSLWFAKTTKTVTDASGKAKTVIKCPRGSHFAPGYLKHPERAKKPCLLNCRDWDPPKTTGRGGICRKPRTKAMRNLLYFYAEQKAAREEGKRYSLKRAKREYDRILSGDLVPIEKK